MLTADTPGRTPPHSGSDRSAGIAAAIAWTVGAGAVLLSVRSFLLNADNSDFASFYESAAAWRAGASAYASDWRPNLNPPAMLWLFAPFTNWAMPAAAWMWIALQVAALLMLVELAARETASNSPHGALVRGLMLTMLAPTVAVAQLLREGQWVLWLAVLVTLAWRASRRGRDVRAAVLIGVLVALKPFTWWFWLALPGRFQPRVLAAGAGAAAATTLASYLTGPDVFAEWLALSGTLTSGHLTHWLNISVPGHLARSFGVSWMAGTIAITALMLPMFVRRAGRGRPRPYGHGEHPDSRWWLAALAVVLASPLGWAYYLVLGIGPAVAHLAARQRPTPLFGAGWIAMLAVWLAAAPVFLCTWIWTAGALCWTADLFQPRSSPTR